MIITLSDLIEDTYVPTPIEIATYRLYSRTEINSQSMRWIIDIPSQHNDRIEVISDEQTRTIEINANKTFPLIFSIPTPYDMASVECVFENFQLIITVWLARSKIVIFKK